MNIFERDCNNDSNHSIIEKKHENINNNNTDMLAVQDDAEVLNNKPIADDMVLAQLTLNIQLDLNQNHPLLQDHQTQNKFVIDSLIEKLGPLNTPFFGSNIVQKELASNASILLDNPNNPNKAKIATNQNRKSNFALITGNRKNFKSTQTRKHFDECSNNNSEEIIYKENSECNKQRENNRISQASDSNNDRIESKTKAKSILSKNTDHDDSLFNMKTNRRSQRINNDINSDDITSNDDVNFNRPHASSKEHPVTAHQEVNNKIQPIKGYRKFQENDHYESNDLEPKITCDDKSKYTKTEATSFYSRNKIDDESKTVENNHFKKMQPFKKFSESEQYESNELDKQSSTDVYNSKKNLRTQTNSSRLKNREESVADTIESSQHQSVNKSSRRDNHDESTIQKNERRNRQSCSDYKSSQKSNHYESNDLDQQSSFDAYSGKHSGTKATSTDSRMNTPEESTDTICSKDHKKIQQTITRRKCNEKDEYTSTNSTIEATSNESHKNYARAQTISKNLRAITHEESKSRNEMINRRNQFQNKASSEEVDNISSDIYLSRQNNSSRGQSSGTSSRVVNNSETSSTNHCRRQMHDNEDNFKSKVSSNRQTQVESREQHGNGKSSQVTNDNGTSSTFDFKNRGKFQTNDHGKYEFESYDCINDAESSNHKSEQEISETSLNLADGNQIKFQKNIFLNRNSPNSYKCNDIKREKGFSESSFFEPLEISYNIGKIFDKKNKDEINNSFVLEKDDSLWYRQTEHLVNGKKHNLSIGVIREANRENSDTEIMVRCCKIGSHSELGSTLSEQSILEINNQKQNIDATLKLPKAQGKGELKLVALDNPSLEITLGASRVENQNNRRY